MQRTVVNEKLMVYDDVLDEESWSRLWTYFQFEQFQPVAKTRGAWRLSDGEPMAGPEFGFSRLTQEAGCQSEEAARGLGVFLDTLLDITAQLEELVGDAWQGLAGRPYVYPPGSALSWHSDDTEAYNGAFVYYVHPEWRMTWGGELLVADAAEPTELPMMPFRFDSRDYDAQVAKPGLGHFVAPRPNRLVVLGAHPHSIARISPAAGENVRASLAGFFLRDEPHTLSA